MSSWLTYKSGCKYTVPLQLAHLRYKICGALRIHSRKLNLRLKKWNDKYKIYWQIQALNLRYILCHINNSFYLEWEPKYVVKYAFILIDQQLTELDPLQLKNMLCRNDKTLKRTYLNTVFFSNYKKNNIRCSFIK